MPAPATQAEPAPTLAEIAAYLSRRAKGHSRLGQIAAQRWLHEDVAHHAARAAWHDAACRGVEALAATAPKSENG